MRKSNFEVLGAVEAPQHPSGQAVVIRDLGPWDQVFTVTNDAENVVASLVRGFGGVRLGARALYYYDSEGELDELLVVDGKFAGFRALALEQREAARRPLSLVTPEADDDDALRTADRHSNNPSRGAGGMSQAEWDREGLGGSQ